jgi:hypothetical protein
MSGEESVPITTKPDVIPEGLITPGNIDLLHRPVVKNEDGSISTVRSMSTEIGGKEILLPTVSEDGKILSDDEAVKQYLKTGKHLGIFDNPDHATSYAQNLHKSQEKLYVPQSDQKPTSQEVGTSKPSNQVTIFDTKSNKPVDVHPDQAGDGFLSGKYGFPAGTKVPIRLRDGTAVTVPVESLASSLTDYGATLLSPAEVAREKLKAKYGGLAGQAATAGINLASGLTFGGSDALAGLAGGEAAKRYINEHNDINPTTATVSRVAGMGLGALASGGLGEVVEGVEGVEAASEGAGIAGKVASAIGAPSRGLSAVGDLAEHVATNVLPKEAQSVAGKLALKAIPTLARSGVEGAAMNGADYLREEALSDNPQLSAEKFASALGHGALLGVATGGLLHATGAVGSEVIGRVAPHLRGLAEEAAVDSVASRAFKNQISDLPGGIRGAGRELLDSGAVGMGHTAADIAPKVEEASQKAASEMNSVLSQADIAGFKGPRVKNIFDSIENDVRPEKTLESLDGGIHDKLDAIKDDISKLTGSGGPDIDALRKQGYPESLIKKITDKLPDPTLSFGQAQSIADRLGQVAQTGSPELQEAMRGVQKSIQDEIVRAGDEASSKLGGKFAEDYQQAQLKYQRLSLLSKAAQDTIDKAANQVHAGLGGLGTVFSVLHPQAAVGGLGLRLASSYVKPRISSTAASLLDKIGSLGAVNQAVASVDRQVARGVARAVGDESVAEVATKEPIEGGYDAMKDSVIHAVSNSDEHAQAIADAAAPIATHSPKVAQAFQQAALRSTIYLANQLPNNSSTDPSSIVTPKMANDDVSDTEKAKFERIYQAVHDPTSLLGRVADGTITPDEVDAVKNTHPNLYNDMSDQLRASLSTAKDIPYARKQALSTFLGQPIDSSMQLPFIQTLQKGSTGKGKKGGGTGLSKGGHARAANLPLAKNILLPNQSKQEY